MKQRRNKNLTSVIHFRALLSANSNTYYVPRYSHILLSLISISLRTDDCYSIPLWLCVQLIWRHWQNALILNGKFNNAIMHNSHQNKSSRLFEHTIIQLKWFHWELYYAVCVFRCRKRFMKKQTQVNHNRNW